MPVTINTETPTRPSADRAEPVAPDHIGSSARWWCAVVVGSLFALPLGWLLSYAAALPLMLGTFFFALLGLIIGAVTFRIARSGGSYRRGAVLIGTTVIVVSGWGCSIYTEAADLPGVMAERALSVTRDLGDRTVDQFQAEVADSVRTYVTDHYPPGGFVGYVRWVIDNGRIPRKEMPLVGRTLSVGQHGWVWLIRVALSVGLLAFGIASQTWPLASRRPPSA